MAFSTDAVMAIRCDVEGDPAAHDDWHTYEHMHERLSIPGFVRGSRWLRLEGSPRYLILYEVASLAIAQSPDYLARLNDPSPWTAATMKMLRNTSRSFCSIRATGGYGLGSRGLLLRLAPPSAAELDRLVSETKRIALSPGMGGVCLLQPASPPPMTTEQSIRGRDAQLDWMLFATAHDAAALEHISIDALDRGHYALSFTATAQEVARTPKNPTRSRDYR